MSPVIDAVAAALLIGGILSLVGGIAWCIWATRAPPQNRYVTRKPVKDDRSSIQRFNDIIGKKV